MTERRPIHLAVALGLTTGLYAASLAAVTGLQAASDRATHADRAPAETSIAALVGANDRLANGIDAGVAGVDLAAGGYTSLIGQIGALEQRLQALGAAVGQVRGGVGSLPGRMALPSIGGSTIRSAAPATQATTSASGKP